MDLVYKLTCGICDKDNYITSKVHEVEWFCSQCDKFFTTWLPTTKTGKLISDPSYTDSLIGTTLAAAPEPLSESYPLGTYDYTQDPVRKDEVRWLIKGSLIPPAPIIGDLLNQE